MLQEKVEYTVQQDNTHYENIHMVYLLMDFNLLISNLSCSSLVMKYYSYSKDTQKGNHLPTKKLYKSIE